LFNHPLVDAMNTPATAGANGHTAELQSYCVHSLGAFKAVVWQAPPCSCCRTVIHDWIVHGFKSPPTQYRFYGRRFYRSEDPTNSIEVLKENSCKGKTRKRKKHKIHIHCIQNSKQKIHI